MRQVSAGTTHLQRAELWGSLGLPWGLRTSSLLSRTGPEHPGKSFDSQCRIPTRTQLRRAAPRTSQPLFPTGLATSALGLQGEEKQRGKTRRTLHQVASFPVPPGDENVNDNRAFPHRAFCPAQGLSTHTHSGDRKSPKLLFINPTRRVPTAPASKIPKHPANTGAGCEDAAPSSPVSASRSGERQTQTYQNATLNFSAWYRNSAL